MNAYIIVFVAFTTVVLSGIVPGEEVISNEEDGANMKYFLVEKGDGTYEIEDLVNGEIQARASESDITYHFFSGENPSKGVTFKAVNIEVLKFTEFQTSRPTVFIVHGWLDNNESNYNVRTRETILSRHDVNVFVVDWEPIAEKNYITAKNAVTSLGGYIASFIQSLVSRHSLKLSDVVFVGHSLGAHIAGTAGLALGGKVGHIVGLDPAGPLYSSNNIAERLDPTDAQFVHVIHTNGGLLGFKDSSGHADYYPNGGGSQPGCGLDITGSCSHARSYAYYTESITSPYNLFVATLCSSYNNYQNGRCSNNGRSLLGGYTIDNNASGDYYLTTNNGAPFARG